MFFGHVLKIEVTKDTSRVNELLSKEWVLLRVLETNAHEFVFLMGLCDYPRSEIVGIRECTIQVQQVKNSQFPAKMFITQNGKQGAP